MANKLRDFAGGIYRLARFKLFSRSNIELKKLNIGIPITAQLVTDFSSSIELEERVHLGKYVLINIQEDCKVVIGKGVFIGDFSIIRGVRCKINIGDNCMIAQHVKLIATNHAYLSKSKLIREQDIDMTKNGISIGEDCWIGAGACVLPGVKVGDGAVVGAMAVVTKNVEPYSVVAGNPARLIKMRQ